ncbi:MAG TPA: PKD domain-containing protein, partial [Brumimicrobium sp.]|nr:PKD domain-containing protein [Brumimicrobium sp.]
MRELNKLIVLFVTLFIAQVAFSHSVQFAYCTSCDGKVRIWVEHWHGSENPGSTTMTMEVIVNGVTTTHTGIPNQSVIGVPRDNLPCASTIHVFGACPGGEANKYNDWVAYDFESLPTNVSIEFRIISGNTAFTADGCNMFPLSTGIIVIPPPPNYVHSTECADENGLVGPIAASTNTVWTNDNPGIGLPASGVGEIPAFVPTPSPIPQIANMTVSNSCGTSPFTITINPSPSADINAAASSSSPICLGEIMSFTDASSPAQSSTLVDFEWDFGDGSVPQNTANPTHVYTQAGHYSAVLTVTDDNTCTDRVNVPVTVLAAPVPDFNAAGVCEDATTNFTNTSTILPIDGDVITGYEWDFGNGATSLATNPTQAFGVENIHNVKLIATSNFGCVDSITKPVEVYPLPVPDFTATKECLHFATQFTDGSTVSNAHT